MTAVNHRVTRVSPVGNSQNTVVGERGQDDTMTDEDEEMGEATEEPIIRTVKDPGCPSQEERDRHYTTHMPYRSWCPVCVQAKGKENPHFRKKEKKAGDKPVVGLDYKSFGQSISEDDKKTAIVMRDQYSVSTGAHIVRCKGASDEYIVEKLMEDIDQMGHTDIILKGDGEPALVQVMEEVKKRRVHDTIIQNPPAYDPQSNGAIEKAVDQCMCQLRSIKIELESRIGIEVVTQWPVIEWMVEYSCTTINRGQVGHDGKTPYRRLMGKEATQPFIEFGEQVLAKPLRQKKTNRKISLATRWITGTWIGLTDRSGENLVALPGGGPVIRVRTVIRKPESERWSPIAVREIKAIPRAPNPKDKAQQRVEPESMTRGISPEGESGINIKVPEVSDQPTVYRDFKITRQILERHGYSDECKGCEAAVMGYPPRQHNQGCRKRLEAEMVKDDALREGLKKRDERLLEDPTEISEPA